MVCPELEINLLTTVDNLEIVSLHQFMFSALLEYLVSVDTPLLNQHLISSLLLLCVLLGLNKFLLGSSSFKFIYQEASSQLCPEDVG